MATNQFLPFGTGANADVLNYADYSALGFRSTGFGTGTAISTQLNTVWRQGAMGAHVLAQLTSDLTNADVADNGQSYLPSVKAAIRSQCLNYAAATGTGNALIVSMDPPLLAHVTGMPIRVLVPTTNSAAATLAVNGLPAAPIRYRDGSALASGELVAGDIVELIWGGTYYIIQTNPRVQSLQVQSGNIFTDIMYQASAVALYQLPSSIGLGTTVGSISLPAGYGSVVLSAEVGVLGDDGASPTGTELFLAIYANDGSATTLVESQRDWKVPGKPGTISRGGRKVLDRTKSYVFTAVAMKNGLTSNATPASGNLGLLASRF